MTMEEAMREQLLALLKMQPEYLDRFIEDVESGFPSKFSYVMLRENYLKAKQLAIQLQSFEQNRDSVPLPILGENRDQ